MKYVNQNTGNGFFEVEKANEEKLDNARAHIKVLLWLYRDDLKHGDISHLEITLEMLDLFELYQKHIETSNRLGIPADTWDEFIHKNRTHFKIPTVSMSHEYDSYVYRCERTDRKPIPLDDFIANYEELNRIAAYDKYTESCKRMGKPFKDYTEWTSPREEKAFTPKDVTAFDHLGKITQTLSELAAKEKDTSNAEVNDMEVEL